MPNRPLDGRTSGKASIGTCRSAHNSSLHARSRMSSSIVRLALVTSVACTSPPVRFQISHASIVPSASCGPTGIWRSRSSHSNLVPEKYGSSTSPVRSRTIGRCPAAVSSSQRAAVRRSCQTIAVPYGAPDSRSQATTVSRWFVIPIAATLSRPTRAITSDERRRHRPPDLGGVVLDPARLRKMLRELLVRRHRGAAVDEHRTAAHARRAGVDRDHARVGAVHGRRP